MLLTIHAPILTKKAFTNVRKTDWAEDREIHSLFCELVVNWISLKKWITRKTVLTKS